MKSPIRIYKSGLHRGEEPLILGNSVSGLINFSGCRLSCKFCYTPEASRSKEGQCLTSESFIELCMELVSTGARNINLITPSLYWNLLKDPLQDFKNRTENKVPIVLKIDGSESPLILRSMLSVADIIVPDFKIWDPELCKEQNLPANYGSRALATIQVCMQHYGTPLTSASPVGELRRGILVRHLLMPKYENDSVRIIKKLAEIGFNGPLNLMTKFIDPAVGRLFSYSKESLERIIRLAQESSLHLLVDGRTRLQEVL